MKQILMGLMITLLSAVAFGKQSLRDQYIEARNAALKKIGLGENVTDQRNIYQLVESTIVASKKLNFNPPLPIEKITRKQREFGTRYYVFLMSDVCIVTELRNQPNKDVRCAAKANIEQILNEGR